MIILRGVNLFPSQIEEILLSLPFCSGHYQLELTHQGLMDELTVHAELQEGVDITETKNAGEKQITKCIKDIIGVSTRVILHNPGEVERSLTGKARRVVDLRPK